MFTAILQIAATVLANLINSRKCSNERADSLNVGVSAQAAAPQLQAPLLAPLLRHMRGQLMPFPKRL